MIEYQQNIAATRIHSVPRFGHTSSLKSLTTGDPEDKEDYIHGIIAFSIFMFCIVLVWSLVLLFLKFYCGVERVGCAARGDPVDPSELRKCGVSRRERKLRMKRAWRVQLCFLGISMLIPCFTCLLINHGYRPFIQSLGEIIQTIDDIESRAFQGADISISLSRVAQKVKDNQMFDPDTYKTDVLCPRFNTSSQSVQSLGLETLQDTLSTGIQSVDRFLENSVPFEVFNDATSATKAADEAIEQIYARDWYLKLLLVLLNVFNLVLWNGAFLTKCGVDYLGFQKVLAWFVVPTFGALLICTVGAGGLLLSLALVNADFCAGGPAPGSPQDTIRDILQTQDYSNGQLLLNSFEFYVGGCSGTDPLAFVDDSQVSVRNAGLGVMQLLDTISALNTTALSLECGRDLLPTISQLEELGSSLLSVAGFLRASTSLTECSEVVGILDNAFNGAACNETIEGLSRMFGGMLALVFVVMIMFSTRAALYNPVFKAKRRRRREREFDEYREFMSQFYSDAVEWQMDPEKKSMLRIDTFESEGNTDSATGSNDTPEHGTQIDEQPDVDNDTTFHTVCHKTFSEQIVMTPLTKMAVAAGAKAAALAAERALLDKSLDNSNIENQDESFESSVDESLEQPSIISNISSLVDRFFSVRKKPRDIAADLSISSYAPSTADSRDVPPSDYAADAAVDLLGAMDHSFDSGSHVDCYIEDADDYEAPTPQVDRSFAPRPTAPHKTVKSLGRTNGGSLLDEL